MLVIIPFTTVTVCGGISAVVNDPETPIFSVDIVPKPVMSVFGIVVEAVKGLVPLPYKYPVKVTAPDPPEATGSVPVVKAVVDVAYIVPPDVNADKAVPPDAVGNGGTKPDILPPVMLTLSAFCDAIVPISSLGVVSTSCFNAINSALKLTGVTCVFTSCFNAINSALKLTGNG